MATDARLATGLPAHPKTKKLIKRLGQASAWNLVCLILWAADNRSDGDLSGMSAEDIELSADWTGDEGQFVAALVAVRFLDGQEGEYMLHDWAEHNPWAAGAESRSAKARWNAAKRHHGIAEADRLVPEYAAIRSATSNATSTEPAQTEQPSSNAPSPSPSPSPSPKTKAPAFVVPDWINSAHWSTWHSCPKRKKATNEQKQMAVDKLDAWRLAGLDYAGALENAAMGGYQGLFLPGQSAAAKPAKQPQQKTFQQINREEGWARWEEQTNRVHPDRIKAQEAAREALGQVIDIAPRNLEIAQ